VTEPDERDDELLYPEVDRLRWLEAKFVLSGLAPDVWQAIDIMRQRDEDGYGDEHVVVVERWIMSYIFEVAAIINSEMREDALAGKKTEILASRLINALGLTASRFKQAALVERDEEIYWEVLNVVDPRTRSTGTEKDKLDNAYDIVAERWGVKRTTISNLCNRTLRRWRSMAEYLGRFGSRHYKKVDGFFQTMQSHVRMTTDKRNEFRKWLLPRLREPGKLDPEDELS
jgi:hypothetical protein